MPSPSAAFSPASQAVSSPAASSLAASCLVTIDTATTHALRHRIQNKDSRTERTVELFYSSASSGTRRLWARRYASTAALECLGATHREAACLFWHYYEAFYEETRHVDAWSETEAGVQTLEKDLLRKKIAQPLSACARGPLPCVHHSRLPPALSAEDTGSRGFTDAGEPSTHGHAALTMHAA